MLAVRIVWNSANMTRLTIAEAPEQEQEFSVRGRNVLTEVDDEGLIFYDDVTKVHVLPDEHRFTIQVVTPDLEVEMDFPDVDSVRDALEHFEAKKVSEVNAAAPGAVRLTPTEPETANDDLEEKSGERPPTINPALTGIPGEILIAPEPDCILEQIPSRPDERTRENLPDTQNRKGSAQ
jgi:uncharacterized protein YdeI (BOF family)